jgi:PTH2 family peptidyl-tRNA hydrolase
MAAQIAHASVSAFLVSPAAAQRAWLQCGMPKTVLKGLSEPALLDLLSGAQAASIPAYLIRDAGRTVVAEGTVTCLGIGPAEKEAIDRLTGDLSLM